MDQSIGSTAAGIVVTAVVQEGVSRLVTHVLGKREERASMEENLERLEWAHSKLELALERSSKLPITDVSLLHQRRAIKRVYRRCDELLSCKRQALDDDHVAKQGVITTTHSSSSFPVAKKITLSAARGVSSFLGMNQDVLSCSAVRRFEWCADEADKFMSKLESGCTLAHYRFFSPLITQLLQGQNLEYEMEGENQFRRLWIRPIRHLEEYGVLAFLNFESYDANTPEKCFKMLLTLRLSEDTDIVRIAIQCLRSLGPQFKYSVQAAIGELSQLPTPTPTLGLSHPTFYGLASALVLCEVILCRFAMIDSFCRRANRQNPCANTVIPSELSCRFPEQVVAMRFDSCISAVDQYNLQSSANEAERNAVNDWPLLDVSVYFRHHYFRKMKRNMCALEIIGEHEEHMDGISLQQVEEMAVTNAISSFIRQPELTKYQMNWDSHHGEACFTLEKPK